MRRMKRIAAAALLALSLPAFAHETDADRRVQKLEEAIARLEARLAKLESGRADRDRTGGKDRGALMGGMMEGGGMMGGSGMMGGGRPNEQWRTPDAKK